MRVSVSHSVHILFIIFFRRVLFVKAGRVCLVIERSQRHHKVARNVILSWEIVFQTREIIGYTHEQAMISVANERLRREESSLEPGVHRLGWVWSPHHILGVLVIPTTLFLACLHMAVRQQRPCEPRCSMSVLGNALDKLVDRNLLLSLPSQLCPAIGLALLLQVELGRTPKFAAMLGSLVISSCVRLN